MGDIDWTKVLIAIAGVAVFAGVAVSWRIAVNRNKTRATVQNNNIVGGDQAGGDIRKTSNTRRK
jgi:hypothetical protein